jgi:hypothetical protein
MWLPRLHPVVAVLFLALSLSHVVPVISGTTTFPDIDGITEFCSAFTYAVPGLLSTL